MRVEKSENEEKAIATGKGYGIAMEFLKFFKIQKMLNFCKNYAQSKMCGWLEILLKKLKTFPSKNQNLPMPTKI